MGVIAKAPTGETVTIDGIPDRPLSSLTRLIVQYRFDDTYDDATEEGTA